MSLSNTLFWILHSNRVIGRNSATATTRTDRFHLACSSNLHQKYLWSNVDYFGHYHRSWSLFSLFCRRAGERSFIIDFSNKRCMLRLKIDYRNGRWLATTTRANGVHSRNVVGQNNNNTTNTGGERRYTRQGSDYPVGLTEIWTRLQRDLCKHNVAISGLFSTITPWNPIHTGTPVLEKGGRRNGWSVSPTPPSSSLCPLPTHYTGVPLPLSGVNLTINIDLELGGVYIPSVFPFRPNTCGILYCFCFSTLLPSIHWREGMCGTRVRGVRTTPVRSIYICRVVFDAIFAHEPLCRQRRCKPFVRWSITRHTS